MQRDGSVVARFSKILRGEMNDIVQEPLPRRWVDLIHYLDEHERKTAPASPPLPDAKR